MATQLVDETAEHMVVGVPPLQSIDTIDRSDEVSVGHAPISNADIAENDQLQHMFSQPTEPQTAYIDV